MIKSIVLTLALGLAPQAWAKSAEIKSFTPQNVTETTNQIRAVFDQDVVKLNAEEDANTAFDVSCTPAVQGRATWEDTKTWSFEFATDIYQNNLPGGTKCSVTLSKEFKKKKGIAGKTVFNFQVDGPNVLAVFPGDRTGKYVAGILEDQIVVLGFDAKIDEASLKKLTYFKVKDIASPVGIAIVGENEAKALMKSDNFPNEMLSLPDVILIRPVTKLPNDKVVDLVIGKGVKSSESGVARLQDLKIPLQTRTTLNATFSCTRENAAAGCSPFSTMELIFSAPIKSDLAKEIKLVAADGTEIKAEIDVEAKGNSYITRVTFPAQYKDHQNYRIVLPEGITDETGRPLQNGAAISKANISTGDFPPLAKFSGEFGLIESADPILPATLRNLEARVIYQKGAPTEIQGSSVRLDSSNFKDIVKWMKKLDLRSRNGAWGEKEDNRRGSIFADLSNEQKKATAKFEIPLSDSGKAFEVVRIDLKKTGFHVVEIQSKILGNSLIAKDATMFVPTSALVTNMVVHSKWGRESSLFWVTALDSGRPVEGAKVVVYDCAGNPVYSGNTNAQGYVKVAGNELNGRINFEMCSYQKPAHTGSDYDDGFFVSAKKDADFTFTFSGWKEGIEPFRFGYSYGTAYTSPHSYKETLVHTVLDRTLFRAGETVGMKFFLRVPTGSGLTVPRAEDLPNQIRIENYGSEAEFVHPIKIRADGTGEFSFEIPKAAKLGAYSITLEKLVGQEVTKSYSAGEAFQVLEYKIPLLKGSVTFTQADNLVQPGDLSLKLSVNYMDGAPVANENVKFRYTISEVWGKYFETLPEFTFARKKVVVGQKNVSEEEENNVVTFERPARLDSNGARIESIPGLSGLDSIREVEAQLEYVDKNGETQNVSRSVSVYPSALLTGVKIENALGSKKAIKFQVAVVNLKGEPVQGASPSVQVYESITYTHKTSIVGGFYTSSSTNEIKAVNAAVTCEAQTSKKGIVNCQAKVSESGSYIVQAQVSDAAGNISYGNAQMEVTGSRQWYPAQNSDRIDLVAEKKEVEAGQEAVFRVETEFDNASVLVTVEREGVLDQFVTTVNTRDPRIRVMMKPEYTPNVYVSAMVVRGRISQNQATATIDPGKPAYQIGMTSVNVGRAPNTLKVAIKTLDKNGNVSTKFKPRQDVKAEVTVTKWSSRGQIPAANAEFAIAVIDKGLLQLSKNGTWDLLDAMLGTRQLEVETATAQMQVVGKRHYGVKAKPTGGDGTAAEAVMAGQGRELFDTRLTWVARVVTDAQGKAVVDFKTNDSPTEFVIVAIANLDADKFGQGEATIVSQPDIMVLPAIGTVVRNGDVYAQEFTLRNTTTSQQSLIVFGKVTFTMKDGTTQLVQVPAKLVKIGSQGDAFVNMGNVTVPEGAVKSAVVYTVTDAKGQIVDEIKLSQEVKPSVLPRVWAAQLNKVDAIGVNFASFIPAEAKAGESLIKVQMLPTLASGLESVNDDFANYPYQSLELMVSRAAATGNAALWKDAMSRLPAHLDSNGLAMFYPSVNSRGGSDALTAYIMSVANYAGLEIPQESLSKMISGLTAVVEGRKAVIISGETQTMSYIRRVNAIEVLNRYGQAQVDWLTALPAVENTQVPTTTLVDLLSIYSSMEVEGGAEKLADVEARLEARMTRTRTEMKFTAQEQRYWFMLTSAATEQLELLNVISRNESLKSKWADRAILLVRGATSMMKAGSWDLTVANATGVLAFKAFAAAFEEGNVTGESKIVLNQVQEKVWNWNAKPEGGVVPFDVKSGNVSVDLKQVGTGTPWAITQVIYAQPVTQKVEAHMSVTKTVAPVKAVYKKGDIVTITLKIQPQTDMPMVSIMDPIPAGAKILGTGLDNDRDQGAVIQQGWAWPDYEFKTYDAYNLSFYEIPAGGVTVAYRVQLNNAGTFKLPATRVEAIYAPENFAEVPNAPFTIQAK